MEERDRFEEAGRRCLEARAGRKLDVQLALTRLAVRYFEGAAQATPTAAPSGTGKTRSRDTGAPKPKGSLADRRCS